MMIIVYEGCWVKLVGVRWYYNHNNCMSRVVLYSIVSEMQVIQRWICSTRRQQLRNFVEAVLPRLKLNKTKLVRTLQVNELWVYYFSQEGFVFVLAAEGTERSARMQNYLRVMAEIFYQNYDETRFPTVVDRIMTEINKIESGEVMVTEEHEGLISGSSLLSEKERFSKILAQKEYNSRRAYIVTVVLFVCIVGLGVNYLMKRYGKEG